MATLLAAIAVTWMMWYQLLVWFVFRPGWNGKATGGNSADDRLRKKRLLVISGVLAIFGTPALFLGFAWLVQTHLA
ncbi:MAG TPA: hypothetical protein VGU61_07435 [Noviherbaspirillum sp.]|uniref:hypothetical protein n=1 Tax=Noviherbaspirillum sp. TaxID=1926288 RepID=UPI002DDD3B95|nr:hypothetical protein [Noviherbaspirillum sp.]HEV2610085.1 hypothetical protein [Noviherbaspirillum sp.]